jgi:hypothetical protein
MFEITRPISTQGAAEGNKVHSIFYAKQFKRANRSLKKLKTYLGRVIRDIRRKMAGSEGVSETFVR